MNTFTIYLYVHTQVISSSNPSKLSIVITHVRTFVVRISRCVCVSMNTFAIYIYIYNVYTHKRLYHHPIHLNYLLLLSHTYFYCIYYMQSISRCVCVCVNHSISSSGAEELLLQTAEELSERFTQTCVTDTENQLRRENRNVGNKSNASKK
jgi:hypothetical protein